MTAFRLADVHFAYGATAVLKGVHLTVHEGEAVALVGGNGAGKTTLTRLLVALLHPDRGTVWVAGSSTSGKAPEDLATSVGYVFQHPDQQLFARTASEEVAFGPRQAGLDAAGARDAALHALARVGLADHAAVHPFDLPPAQRKLVTIAAAVAHRPRVLVLDEPTQGLDREAAARISALLRELAAEGVAVLAVSHDLAFVAETCDRVVVLADGVVAADAPAAELIADRDRVQTLDLVQPPAARLSLALALPGLPIRVTDVAAALTGRHP